MQHVPCCLINFCFHLLLMQYFPINHSRFGLILRSLFNRQNCQRKFGLSKVAEDQA